MRYEFAWNPAKAHANKTKHGVRFEDAMAVFHDKLALTLFDAEHSRDEDRWVSLGMGGSGKLLVVIHTFDESQQGVVRIRIISVRKPTRREVGQYREGSES